MDHWRCSTQYRMMQEITRVSLQMMPEARRELLHSPYKCLHVGWYDLRILPLMWERHLSSIV